MKFLKYASIAIALFLITVLTANLTMADPGCGYEESNYEGLQDQRIETLLGEEGLIGEIHGSRGGLGCMC
ncbi:MAG: hypothetical protein HC796_05365 [Synechococcaceae cyanobacterium RL_1_2]|nr:hypothetical protein [Synechococcaceae cyanobacterium RL_1_2]